MGAEFDDGELLRTLEAIAQEDSLNDWIFSRISPHVRGRILEVGCGIGTFSKRLIGHGDLVGIDPWPLAVERCRSLMGGQADFRIGDILNLPPDFRSNFDTVVCLNVLEHIEDDAAALKAMGGMLNSGGRLILLVPQGPWLFGSLDRAFGHQRRYRKKELAELLHRAGFLPEDVRKFNFLGIFGWFIASKIIGATALTRRLLHLYRVLMPPFRWMEDRIGFPVGLSLLAVARRSV